MVMMEKSISIIIFFYAASFAMLGIQFSIGDVYGITLTGVDGTSIRSSVLDYINTGLINNATFVDLENEGGSGPYNQTTFRVEPIIAAAGLVVEIFTIITGTYIFNVLFHVAGVPAIPWLAGFVTIYAILMIRAVIGYLRGI